MATDTDDGDGLAVALAALGATPAGDDPHARAMLERIRGALTGKSGEPVRIGRFEVDDVLGRGGMGVVYAAHDPNLGRDVAVKLIEVSGADDSARVLREARALARVEHPAVVRVYEADVVDDAVYIAMERVDGVGVARWREQERPGVGEILRVFRAAGRGLAAAHEAGVVHGDFKPDNLLVGEGGGKIVDFGLARLADRPDREPPAGSPGELAPGWTVARAGTPGYMAPEQIRGERADQRSDQFGFCVALFEALSGQRPFYGATGAEQAERVCRGDIDRHALRRLPRRLRPVLERGLAVEPADRHASMTALLDALAGRAWLRPAVGVALAVAVTAAVAVFLWSRGGGPRGVAIPALDAGGAVSVASPVRVAAGEPSDGGAGAGHDQPAIPAERGAPPPVASSSPAAPSRRAVASSRSAKPAAPPSASTRPASGTTGSKPGHADRLLEPGSPEMLASVERMNADKAERAGKAEACLRMLDRAIEISPGPEGRNPGLTRARCEMRAGRCDAGKKRYAEVWIAGGGNPDYARKEAARLAEVFCPPTSGALSERLDRLVDQARSAGFRGDLGQCETLLGVAEAMTGEVTTAEQRKALAKAFGSLSRGFAKKVSCDLARRARAGYFVVSAGMSEAKATQAGADWAEVECKPPEPSPFEERPRRYQYIPP